MRVETVAGWKRPEEGQIEGAFHCHRYRLPIGCQCKLQLSAAHSPLPCGPCALPGNMRSWVHCKESTLPADGNRLGGRASAPSSLLPSLAGNDLCLESRERGRLSWACEFLHAVAAASRTWLVSPLPGRERWARKARRRRRGRERRRLRPRWRRKSPKGARKRR